MLYNFIMFKKTIKTIIVVASMIVSHFQMITIQAEENNTLLDNVNAGYVLVWDYELDQVLVDKNASEKIYPASMTKMMTAILAIENEPDLTKKVTITQEMLDGLIEQDASCVGYKVGDEPTIEDLLYGIALPSGADAANAVAVDVSGSITSFVDLMNQKAKEIGMNDTHFVNTTGLHDDNHYSTVNDIAKLLRYCLDNEQFKEVFSSDDYTSTPVTSNQEGIYMKHSVVDKMEKYGYDMPGYIGGKPGYTLESARSLASWDRVNGMNLIIIVAKCEVIDPEYKAPHVEATNTLLHNLQSWKRETLVDTDTQIATININHVFSSKENLSIKATDTIKMDIPKDSDITFTTTLPTSVDSTNKKQTLNKEYTVSLNDEVLETFPITVTIEPESHIIDKIILWIKGLSS